MLDNGRVPRQRNFEKFSSTEELARSMGLSRWTVSRALNGRGGVCAETAQRVVETATRHGFSPSALGRGLRAGVTPFIGVCAPGIEEYSLSGKIVLLQELIAANGCDPLFLLTDGTAGSEERALARFAAMRCRAVVTIASRISPVQSAAAGVSRVVRVDPVVSARGLGSVSVDRACAMGESLRHLHSLGHRAACVAGVDPGDAYAGHRHRGLERAAQTLGWKSGALHFLAGESANEDFSRGRSLAGSYLALGRGRAPAIVAVNDRVAFAMVTTLARSGLHTPGDFSIVGYDGLPLSEIVGLTTIDPQPRVLVDAVGKMLFSKSPNQSRLVAPVLIVRESTGVPPRNSRATASG